jgi:hypothetical protein
MNVFVGKGFDLEIQCHGATLTQVFVGKMVALPNPDTFRYSTPTVSATQPQPFCYTTHTVSATFLVHTHTESARAADPRARVRKELGFRVQGLG